ncbi:hypothetical protein KHQ81_15725 (plasmid) [Mycoplasmatota bacterium]|nr:hypothetical protein KHQ81_15725 [Mycoplasmatota bacterium]
MNLNEKRKITEQALDNIEFELIKVEGGYAVWDLQETNLGDIDKETFKNMGEVLHHVYYTYIENHFTKDFVDQIREVILEDTNIDIYEGVDLSTYFYNENEPTQQELDNQKLFEESNLLKDVKQIENLVSNKVKCKFNEVIGNIGTVNIIEFEGKPIEEKEKQLIAFFYNDLTYVSCEHKPEGYLGKLIIREYEQYKIENRSLPNIWFEVKVYKDHESLNKASTNGFLPGTIDISQVVEAYIKDEFFDFRPIPKNNELSF